MTDNPLGLSRRQELQSRISEIAARHRRLNRDGSILSESDDNVVMTPRVPEVAPNVDMNHGRVIRGQILGQAQRACPDLAPQITEENVFAPPWVIS